MLLDSKRQQLLALSLVSALAMTACGSKKEVYGNSKKPTIQTQGQAPGPVPETNSQGGEAELPIPGAPESQSPEALPVPVDASQGQLPPVMESQPVSSLELNPLPQDYEPNNAAHVAREGLSKRATGGQTSDGLLYTSSSTDAIHAFLRARNEKVSWGQKRLNLEMAANVQHAKMHVDSLSGETTVVVKLKEGSGDATYVMAGAMGEGSAQPLKVVRGGGNDKTTGNRSIEGTIKCLDLDGLCENTFARLRINDNGLTSVVNLIFRQSNADVYFHLPGEYSENPEYLELREFIHNSIKGVTTADRLRSVKMKSWEVVNGRSGFEVEVLGRNKEMLGFRGPLLAPEVGTAVNVVLSRVGKENTDSLDLLALGNVKLNYANTIQEAKMINNNGLGQVRIAVKMRKRAHYAQDQFAMTIMRKIKPIIELTDESLK
ncbi:MAG: hypothetical protein ACLGGX_02670 [Bdellovibrionia bacterium]